MEKKTDCYWYEPIVQATPIQIDDYVWDTLYELQDEVCHCPNKGGPLHYDEYDCTGCPFYKKIK